MLCEITETDLDSYILGCGGIDRAFEQASHDLNDRMFVAVSGRRRELRELADPSLRLTRLRHQINDSRARMDNAQTEVFDFMGRAYSRLERGDTELAVQFMRRAQAALQFAVSMLLSIEEAEKALSGAGHSSPATSRVAGQPSADQFEPTATLPIIQPLSVEVRKLDPAVWGDMPCDSEMRP